mmetsp:Transcript_56196/g.83581  ORF Transcript_56196/g.83581 Transcript_56196/m.83581 type:complete len:107 (-) Transcript_56196:10-330(-)
MTDFSVHNDFRKINNQYYSLGRAPTSGDTVIQTKKYSVGFDLMELIDVWHYPCVKSEKLQQRIDWGITNSSSDPFFLLTWRIKFSIFLFQGRSHRCPYQVMFVPFL